MHKSYRRILFILFVSINSVLTYPMAATLLRGASSLLMPRVEAADIWFYKYIPFAMMVGTIAYTKYKDVQMHKRFDKVDGKLDYLQNELGEARTSLDELKTTGTATQETVVEIQQKVKNILAVLDELSKNSATKEAVNEIKSQVAEIQTNLDRINTTANAIQTNQAETQSLIKTLKQQATEQDEKTQKSFAEVLTSNKDIQGQLNVIISWFTKLGASFHIQIKPYNQQGIKLIDSSKG